jgi:hypothetical protein
VVSGTRVGVPLRIHIVPSCRNISMFILSTIVCIEPFVAVKSTMSSLPTYLARYFVVVVAVSTTAPTSTSTVEATVTTAMKATMATSATTTEGGVDADLLLLVLRLHSSFSREKLRVEVIERIGLGLGCEHLNKRIKVNVQSSKDVCYHLFIIKMFPGPRHLIGVPFHVNKVCSTCSISLARNGQL